MRVFAPLRRRSIALLWMGQVLSNLGDEVYSIALIWLAADLIGPRAGYVAALQSASIFVCGLLVGPHADGWDHRRTMVAVDVLRGATVLMVPVCMVSGVPSLWVLVPVAVVVSGLSALFLPALKASLPELVSDAGELQATNGLMETTLRLARVAGPALVGLLHGLLPIVHFFTVDAVSFLCSALSIQALHRDLPASSDETRAPRMGMRAAWRALEGQRELRFAVVTSPPSAALWWLVLALGLALLVHASRPDDVGALGWMLAAYGIGNLGSTLVLGGLPIRRPLRLLHLGRITAGLGFVGLALSGSRWGMMAFAAVAATGGPMTDIGFLSMLAVSGDRVHIARTYRLCMSFDYGAMVLAFIVSPWLFEQLGISHTIFLCGGVVAAFGLVGLAWAPDRTVSV